MSHECYAKVQHSYTHTLVHFPTMCTTQTQHKRHTTIFNEGTSNRSLYVEIMSCWLRNLPDGVDDDVDDDDVDDDVDGLWIKPS